jgi:hypothetical protein
MELRRTYCGKTWFGGNMRIRRHEVDGKWLGLDARQSFAILGAAGKIK